MSAKPITGDAMSQFILETMDRIIESHYPEEEREEAKARLLNAFADMMFQKVMGDSE